MPFFQGVGRPRLGPDTLAGITLAVLAIPEVMGYARIIGTPVITGLYTLFLPVLAFAVFGSSRQLVVSADSATAAMVAAALTSQSLAANTPKYVELTTLIAAVTAAILLLARIFRLAFLADFLSRTVLIGFLSGVGVQVAAGQLPEILGIERGDHRLLAQLRFTLQNLPHVQLSSLSIALAVLITILGFELLAPRVPGPLIAVVGLTAASAFFRWGEKGIALVGPVPSGLPAVGVTSFTYHDVMAVLPISFSCFIVVIAQSAATSRAYALRHRDHFDENADLIGLSMANLAAACSGAFVVNGSPTKTAIVDTAGGRSQWSHLTTAAVVMVVLLFLTRPLSFLPTAVLAAIVFLVGLKLVDLRGLAEIRATKPGEFVLAATTAITVVLLGVEEGIILAVVLSLLQHVRHSYRPHTAVFVREGPHTWRMDDPAPGKMVEPGLVMFWFGSDLFYANVTFFTAQLRKLVHQSPSPVRWLVIDATAITDVDFTAGSALAELRRELEDAGVVLALIVVSARQDEREDWGLNSMTDATRIFESREACLAAYLSERERDAGAPRTG